MDISTEKINIIQQVIQIQDEELLNAVKNLLDFGLKHQTPPAEPVDFWDKLSEEQRSAIEHSLQELDEGKGIPHENVMASFRKKLSA